MLSIKNRTRNIFIGVMLMLVGTFLFPVPIHSSMPDELDENRARLLTYVVRRQIENHFSGKPIDDALSEAAFHLYIKQMDFQKRLFLASEVDQLKIYSDRIDDEIRTGRIVLAPLAYQLLTNSIDRAEHLADKALGQPFDFSIDESYESDPEKLEFCDTEKELAERWRLELKFRVLARYLNLLEDEGIEDPLGVSQEMAREKEQEAREKVRNQYEQYFARLKKETIKDHYDRYLNSFARAFDPHTTYMPPQSKEDFDISMRGSLEGIGATLREEDGYIKVVKVIPGSAADRQGQLLANDVILAVGQEQGEMVDITDMRLRDAVSLIRGEKGTKVRLSIRRPGLKNFVIAIVRDVVIIEESFVKSTTITEPTTGNQFGYIKIPSFYRDFESTRNGSPGRNSTDDVKDALKAFDQTTLSGLILDLRNNGGGALTDAVGIAGLFIGEGPIVQVRTGEGDAKVLRSYNKQVAYSGPMIVLVNQFSASASEIVAGALQDYGRAIVIGSDHTHGKGTVQVIMDLDESLTLKNMRKYMPLGALKMTTQKFYRISGDSTQYRGVIPDIVLPDSGQFNEYGERYLDYSLPWDRIEAVEHLDWPQFDQQTLIERSQERVANSKEFSEIRQISDAIQERIQNTRQSLKIADVVAERDVLQALSDNPHSSFAMDDINSNEPAEEEPTEGTNSIERLIQQVTKDPYVLESMAVLDDFVALKQDMVAGKDKE